MPTFTHAAEGLVNGDIFANPVFVPSTTDTNTIGEYEIIVNRYQLRKVVGGTYRKVHESRNHRGPGVNHLSGNHGRTAKTHT